MNVRRGLFRLWVICSVAWIAVVGFDAIYYWQAALSEGEQWTYSIRPHLAWALGPPTALLVLYAAVQWISVGFKHDGPVTNRIKTAKPLTVGKITLPLATIRAMP